MTLLFGPIDYAGNHVSNVRLCYQQEEFLQSVIDTQGWVFANDGTAEKPKWGFVAWEPGAVLKVRPKHKKWEIRDS